MTPEQWPTEAFVLLEDEDISQLIHDASQELHRRYVVSLELEHLWEMNT